MDVTLPAPRPGDVVVTRRGDLLRTGYLVHVHKGATQLMFEHREDALRDATTFADIHRVDVWYTADGRTFKRMARYRRRDRAAEWAEATRMRETG